MNARAALRFILFSVMLVSAPAGRALTIDQSASLTIDVASHGGELGIASWEVEQFSSALGTLTGIEFQATLRNSFVLNERNPFGVAGVYAPWLSWSSRVVLGPAAAGEFGSAGSTFEAGPVTIEPDGSFTVTGVLSQELLANLDSPDFLDRFTGDGSETILLVERVFFFERWGNSSAVLDLDLRLTYHYENAAISPAGQVPDGGRTAFLLALGLAGILLVRAGAQRRKRSSPLHS